MEESHDLREYRFPSAAIQVKISLEKILAAQNEPDTQKSEATEIANRLHRKEQDTQEKVRHLTSLQEGSLLLCMFKVSGSDEIKVILAKIDHSDFLSLEHLKFRQGLPRQKQALKSAVGTFTNGKIETLFLADSNNRISEYWWKLFLELEEIRSDEQNTTKAFRALDSALSSGVKKQSKADYLRIWNNLVAYFKQPNGTFSPQTLIAAVVDSHESISPDLDLPKLKDQLTTAITKSGIDTTFGLDVSKIKGRARFKKVISLTDDVELHLKASYDHSSVIVPYEEAGEKGIKIKTIEGYEYFKKS